MFTGGYNIYRLSSYTKTNSPHKLATTDRESRSSQDMQVGNRVETMRLHVYERIVIIKNILKLKTHLKH